jgi:hypothetical protein
MMNTSIDDGATPQFDTSIIEKRPDTGDNNMFGNPRRTKSRGTFQVATDLNN